MALVAAFGVAALPTQAAAPVMMSPDWAKHACAAWNRDPVLTDGLVKSGWVDNDNKRGYKVMHVFRTECKDSRPVELRIAKQEGKAMCVYGGAIENPKLDGDVDYLMHAETERWIEMGLGDYGPMRAMMFGREPDSFLGYLALGLTMGQWLSIPMILAGIGLFAWSRRSR